MKKKRYFICYFSVIYIFMNLIPMATKFFWGINTENSQNQFNVSQNQEENTSQPSKVEVKDKLTLDKIKSDGYFMLYDEGIQSDKEEDKLVKVNYLDYVILATACELYPDYNKEAIKSQAICCFTYAVKLKTDVADDITPILTVDSSKFLGYATKEQFKNRWGDNFDIYYNKFEECAKEVLGTCIVYQDKPIVAAYHAISTGKTEDSGVVWQQTLDYLKPVDSQGDNLAKDYERVTNITKDDVINILKNNILTKDLAVSDDFNNLITDIVKNDSKTVTSANLCGNSFTGQQIRKIFNLPSASFDFSYDSSAQTISFKTIGYGHCVGLSQNGADFMARQGNNYEQILKHYFTSVELKKLF